MFTIEVESQPYGLNNIKTRSSPQWWSGGLTTPHDVLNDLRPFCLWYLGVGDELISSLLHIWFISYVFELFSWLQKRFHSSDQDMMTNTALEATALSSDKIWGSKQFLSNSPGISRKNWEVNKTIYANENHSNYLRVINIIILKLQLKRVQQWLPEVARRLPKIIPTVCVANDYAVIAEMDFAAVGPTRYTDRQVDCTPFSIQRYWLVGLDPRKRKIKWEQFAN